MKTDMRPRGVLRLTPCTYGLSKIPFRGPMRPTDGRFVAFSGGSETFAKYVARPFPDLIETALGEVCVNLGCQSAGPDVFLQDTAVQSLCHDAVATVVQVLGAVNQTNPFYKIHPRRNDRFIAPTDKLAALYPEIGFAEISFTGHLISRLRAVDEVRFGQVQSQLEATWVQRMKALVGPVKGPVFLLWLAPHSPRAVADDNAPALVTRDMLDALRPYVADIIEVCVPSGKTEGMCFAPLEALTAGDAFGSNAHFACAKALCAPLRHALD